MTENHLEKFKAYHQLTIDEAMNLILGREPGKWLIFSQIEEKDMPSEAVPIYRALIHDINRFAIPLYDNGIRIHENTFPIYYGSEYYNNLPQGWWIGKTLLTKTLIKWLINNNISSTFFDCSQINEPDYLNNQLDEYSYKLAAAIKVWQHFYEEPARILSGKSLKQQMGKWLTDNAIDLNLLYNNEVSKQAIEDIARVAHWQPKGGAPKS